ncbi:MAG: glycosyltransferase family 4 protein [Cyclobacteriaceae bacterium]|nr:glycosyltransferase family 4 protein [Cyclobacteriaceae bacterium]
MKRILLINNGYPTAKNPNYVPYVNNIERALVLAGYSVDLLVMNSDHQSFFGKYRRYINYYLKLLLFSKYGAYNFIYINNYPYSFLPLILHFKQMNGVVIHWHGDDIFPETKFSSLLNSFAYKFLRKNFIHLAPSSYFASEAARTLLLERETVFVSPSGGVDINLFKPDRQSKSVTTLRLGFASALLGSKGLNIILSLLDRKKSIEERARITIEFHFIDYGQERELFTKQIAKYPNTVRHNPYPLSRMNEFYNSIDILLFPSLRRAESLGLVAIEAMACNVPVIASDAFAFQETVISRVSGERFPVNDYSAFEGAVLDVYKNIAGYSPRKFIIENFSMEAVAEGYKKIL